MIYRIVAVYLPDHPRMQGIAPNGTFTFKRGAWRVMDCFENGEGSDVFTCKCPVHGEELHTLSDRPARKGTLFNPTAALNRALAARRNNGKAA